MEGYVVSLNDNVLSVSLLGGEGVFERELSREIASEGSIVDAEKFAESLGDLILESFGEEQKKLPLHFLIPASEVVLNFITDNKKEKNSVEERLQADVAKRLAAVALNQDDVYFAHQKIAPFVHQLVAIKKDIFEKYLSIGDLIGFEVRSVVPWVLLLPKFLPSPVEPKIFILKSGDEETLVLSELGGIYYVGRFNEKKASDLKKLVKELSVYERNQPISNIYLFGMKSFDLGDDYSVSHLDIKTIHELYLPGVAGDVLNTQVNLQTLLPVPEEKKSMIPVYVGVALGALLLIMGLIYVKNHLNRPQSPAGPTSETQESTEVSESTVPGSSNQQTQEQVELNKAYLRIRVENGTDLGGLAGRTRDHLATFGYEIVSVGDAQESDRTVTLARFSPENAIYKDLLVADLKEMYTDVQVQEDLSSDLGYDVLIIAGSNEKE